MALGVFPSPSTVAYSGLRGTCVVYSSLSDTASVVLSSAASLLPTPSCRKDYLEIYAFLFSKFAKNGKVLYCNFKFRYLNTIVHVLFLE